jgi:integrase
MPRHSGRVPAYGLHKPTGQARVVLDGSKHVYLGPHGSPESYEKYARLIAELAARSPSRPPTPHPHNGVADLTVNELILAYWRFAESYYSREGKPTKELGCMREALCPLRRLYGHSAAQDFGPRSLKALRQHLIDQGLSRGVINHRVNRVKRMVKWAVAEELVPASTLHGLQAVPGLRFGRSAARETEPVRPIAPEAVKAVLPFVSPQVAAMIQLQELTGMRPGEVVLMRPCDIDRSGAVWIYEPHDHKTRWRGHRRVVPLGPQAQRILALFLDRASESYIFSPAEAEAWRNQQRVGKSKPERKTPIYPCEMRARERARQARRRAGLKTPETSPV